MMKTLQGMLAITWNELQVLWTDKGALAILFLLPLLLSSLFGGNLASARNSAETEASEPAFTLDVYLLNQDPGQYGAQVASAVDSLDMFSVEKVSSTAEADEHLVAGEAAAAIVIPADFSEKIDAYQPAEVQVIVDPTQPESASVVSGVMNNVVDGVRLWGEISHGVRTVFADSGVLEGADTGAIRAAEAQTTGVIMTQLNEMRQNPAISVESTNLAGGDTVMDLINTLFAALMPGFAVMFAFFLVPEIAQSIFTEKDQGSFRRLMAAPLHRGVILAGKMLAYVLVASLQVIVLFTMGSILGMSLGGSIPGLVLVTAALGLVVTALGMLVAAVARNRKQADSIGTLLGFALAGISGSIPVGALLLAFRNEGFLGTLARLTPHAHALEGYFRLLGEDAGVVDVLPQVGILVVFSAAFYLLALWRFRFD